MVPHKPLLLLAVLDLVHRSVEKTKDIPVFTRKYAVISSLDNQF
jgi:hypothetical protein